MAVVYKKEILKGTIVPYVVFDGGSVLTNKHITLSGICVPELLPYLKNNTRYLQTYVSLLAEECNTHDLDIILSSVNAGVTYAIKFNIRIPSIETQILAIGRPYYHSTVYEKHFNISL